MKDTSEDRYYVYAHYRPNDETTPFLIGKGSGRRAYDKGKKERNKWWHHIVSKNGLPIVKFVCTNLTESEAFWLEENLIAAWGRADLGKGPLVNLTDGGEGMSGHIQSESQRKKNGDAHRGQIPWSKGKTGVFKKETIDAMREARLGVEPWNKGKTDIYNEEAIESMRLARLGKPLKESTKLAIAEANRGKTRSPESKERYRAMKLNTSKYIWKIEYENGDIETFKNSNEICVKLNIKQWQVYDSTYHGTLRSGHKITKELKCH